MQPYRTQQSKHLSPPAGCRPEMQAYIEEEVGQRKRCDTPGQTGPADHPPSSCSERGFRDHPGGCSKDQLGSQEMAALLSRVELLLFLPGDSAAAWRVG